MNPTESPHVQLEVFEGPLDLLLHLIRKSDLDIYDIPVTPILEQYFDYLEALDELNIDVAGDFILMASELSHIKSRMLLKRDDEVDEEGPDPRADLVARLLEYQQYKRAADWLESQPILGKHVFARPKLPLPDDLKAEEGTMDLDAYKLLSAFGEILKRAPKDSVHEIEIERLSVTDRMYQIVDKLKNNESMEFEALFDGIRDRPTLVVTFLAILEMARLKMLQVFQMDSFGPIRVRNTLHLGEPVETIN